MVFTHTHWPSGNDHFFCLSFPPHGGVIFSVYIFALLFTKYTHTYRQKNTNRLEKGRSRFGTLVGHAQCYCRYCILLPPLLLLRRRRRSKCVHCLTHTMGACVCLNIFLQRQLAWCVCVFWRMMTLKCIFVLAKYPGWSPLVKSVYTFKDRERC